MFSFLQSDLPAVGRVLYPGTIPPPLEQIPVFREPVTWTRLDAAVEQLWAVVATHPKWGKADIACDRHGAALPDVLIDHSLALTEQEKARARVGMSRVAVRVHARHRHVLRDRKSLLFWLRALLQADGVIAVDGNSTLLWSLAMLDDELAHDADLDIESLYAIHAVRDPQTPDNVSWLHTHGLGSLGAFDFDVLEPSRLFASHCGDAIRSLAFAALEGTIADDTARYELAFPGGVIRFVPVSRFQAQASPHHRTLRDLEPEHGAPRAVLCEPAAGLFGRWRTRPIPSRFLARLDDDRIVFPFSPAATALMSERARQTLAVFRELREEFASLGLPALVKLGYEVAERGPDGREHLWFEVHRITGDTVEATLANTPHRVPGLTVGERGEYDLSRLSDWTIISPEGPMTPRNIGASRRLRDARSTWQARIDAANTDNV